MKNKYASLIIAAGLTCFGFTAHGFAAELDSLSQQAVSVDSKVSGPAMAALRARGPAGLEALLKANAQTLRQQELPPGIVPLPEQQAVWQRLQTALDTVSAQRDDQASRLYLYTDFDQAKEAAQIAGKPILSLRLLGKLDEEYSCANSRYFRTTLYANRAVSQYLREHFILHWQSVRPVPRVTVDFGDGRKIERTLTGNSIHYILDAAGRPIDALPGLYGAQTFLEEVSAAQHAAAHSAALTGEQKDQYLRQYHQDRLAAISQNWRSDLALTGVASIPTYQGADDATWRRIATLHWADAPLDEAARALINSKLPAVQPTAIAAGRLALSKSSVESPLAVMMNNLQRSIAEDTVRNEYLLHSQIHQWLSTASPTQSVDQLNQRVYASLFLTPDSDPWLGLVPNDVFSGLENDGLVQSQTTR